MNRKMRQLFLAIYGLLAATTMALAACASSSPAAGSGTPTATATSTSSQATAILNHAKQAPLKDATFSFAISGAISTTIPTTNGTGRLTTNPARTDLVFPSIQVQGFTTSGEVIIDQASGDYYISAAALGSQWLKVNPATLGVNIGAVTILDYDGLQNLVYVGAETINGIATWHIQGTKLVTESASQGNATVTRTEEYWFRQSDYYPVQIAFHDVVNAASGATGTPSPTGSPTVIPPSISTPIPVTPVATTTLVPSPTATSAQATFSEMFSFSAWDSGLTISLPTNVVGS